MNFIIVSSWSSSVTRFAKPVNLFFVACRKEFLHESDYGVVCQSCGI